MIETAIPRPELQRFVRIFAQREHDGSEHRQADTASLVPILAFAYGTSPILKYEDGRSRVSPLIHLAGSQRRPSGMVGRLVGRYLGFGIFFRPLALWQLFRIPLTDITGGEADGTDVFGSSIYSLWMRLGECGSFRERIHVAEQYLLPFALHAAPRTGVMKSAQYAHRNHGAIRIEELAHHTGLSVRQYERRFARELGLSPKLFTRISRFQMALDLKRGAPDRSWMSVAHQLGYFDQMHMVRDFQSLGGSLPGEILSHIGDFQPWSIVPPTKMGTFGLLTPP